MRIKDLFTRPQVQQLEKRDFGYPSPFAFRFGNVTNAGIIVNDRRALGLPAVYHCVNLIADNVAVLPIHGYRNDMRLDPTPRLLDRPNSMETVYDTYFSIVVSLLLRGNAYCALGDFDAMGYPRQLQVLSPDNITVKEQGGTVTYVYQSDGGQPYTFADGELLHIHGFKLPGQCTGLGVIEAQREGLGQSLAQQAYAAHFFRDSAMPSGVFTTAETLDDENRDLFKAEWNQSQGNGKRGTAVLPVGMDFKPISITPADSQFLESRNFSLLEIGLMFSVPPSMLGAAQHNMTYTNSEIESLQFYRTTIRQWTTRIELALSDLLPRGTDAKFNLDAILRGDTMERYQVYAIGISSGFLTIDEVREMEQMEPLDPANDVEPADVVGTEAEETDNSDIDPNEMPVIPDAESATNYY